MRAWRFASQDGGARRRAWQNGRGRWRESGAALAGGAHIVVVDDDAAVRETLVEYLTLRGFVVSAADGGASLRRIIARKPATVVLLDINMPGEDGLSLARFLRSQGKVGIIMVSAAGESVDRVVGLEMGADDYITKPFDLREVLARVKSVLRRVEVAAPAPTVEARDAPASLRFDRFILDLGARQLLVADGPEIPLTSMEFDLLKALVTHPNKVLSRDQLLTLAHNRDWDPFDRSIDIRITRLRRKIEVDPAKPQLIKTVRGTGYMFVPDRKS
jgi:two-component system, OmpR family, phosphate regulon response regulator OmpR